MENKENKSGTIKNVKKELIRSLMLRTQGRYNSEKQLPLKGAENVCYADVEENLNVPYMNRAGEALAMDIFKPADSGGRSLPVIVTIHGGGLVIGDRSISRPFSRLLAHKGYLVFSLEYRLAPTANFCEQLNDVCAGMDFVSLKLADYHTDLKRVFLVAESAGAYLAAYSAAMRGSAKLQEVTECAPSHLQFAALGLNCGMFYTCEKDILGWLLPDQIYGTKCEDNSFMEFMNPENPEILNNLPPIYFTTSRGDFLNAYSIKMHQAMDRAGKCNHFVYYPDEDLDHAFFTLQTHHPTTYTAIDKMFQWLEGQAYPAEKKKSEDSKQYEKQETILPPISDGNINYQPADQNVKETEQITLSEMLTNHFMDFLGKMSNREDYDKYIEH